MFVNGIPISAALVQWLVVLCPFVFLFYAPILFYYNLSVTLPDLLLRCSPGVRVDSLVCAHRNDHYLITV